MDTSMSGMQTFHSVNKFGNVKKLYYLCTQFNQINMRNLINLGVNYSIVAILLFLGYHSIMTMYFILFSASGIFGIICALITDALCLAIIMIAGILAKSILFTKTKIKRYGTY